MQFKKTFLTGAIALGTLVSAGAASAAPYSAPDNNNTFRFVVQQQDINLSSLLKANPQLSKLNLVWTGMIYVPGNGVQPGTVSTGSKAPQGGNAQQVAKKPAPAAPSTAANPGSAVKPGTDATTNASAYASQVVNLVNQERAKAGQKPLASDSSLSAMAGDKAKDMSNNHYFDHTSPTYGSPFDMMKSYGIRYTYAGENIAMGQRTPQEVMNSWMNSEGHRQNILSPNFTKIGVSYYNGYWVQEFIAN